MKRITITIEGVKCTPSWVTLQEMLQQSLKCEKATITRISRQDGVCDYRAPGEYDLAFLRTDEYETEMCYARLTVLR